MSITYYDPNRPQQRQYEFIMQSLMNIAMQKRQLAARKEEAEGRKIHEEAMLSRQQRGIEAREAKQREFTSLQTAAKVGREKRAKWDAEEKAVPPAIKSERGVLQWDKESKTYKLIKGTEPTPDAPTKGANFYWQRDPKDPTKFIKTKVPVPVTGSAGSGKGSGTEAYKIPAVMDDTVAHFDNLIDDLDKQFGTRMSTGEYRIDYTTKKDTPYGNMTYDQAVKIVRAREAKAKRTVAAGGVPAFLSSRERILEQRRGYIRSTIDRYRRY